MENAAKDGFTYGAEAAVVPVKCTGLVKVSSLLKLFAKGMRGVLVLGCDEGDCRYYNGSKRCAEIVEETREILDLAGISRDRLQFHMIAESQGKEFKHVFKSFLRQVGRVVTGGAKRRGGKGGRAGKGKPKTERKVAGRKGRVAKKAGAVRKGTESAKPGKGTASGRGKKSAGKSKRAKGTGTVKRKKSRGRKSMKGKPHTAVKRAGKTGKAKKGAKRESSRGRK
jgi:coenzyme F420-reducing hydrogenase delta subunit